MRKNNTKNQIFGFTENTGNANLIDCLLINEFLHRKNSHVRFTMIPFKHFWLIINDDLATRLMSRF